MGRCVGVRGRGRIVRGAWADLVVVTMHAGSCWLQPPRIKHTVLDYSDDCEVLEIIVPADFKTVELTK